MRNIELKARLNDLPAARRVADALATQQLGIQDQIDTYFRCTNGRLKLRQIGGQTAQLIWYVRPSDPRPKASDYHIVAVPQPDALIAALRAAMGIVNVVRKRHESTYGTTCGSTWTAWRAWASSSSSRPCSPQRSTNRPAATNWKNSWRSSPSVPKTSWPDRIPTWSNRRRPPSRPASSFCESVPTAP